MTENKIIRIEKETKITVIDEIMGFGKTSRAFDEINNNPDKRYLFVTLLKTELERFEESCDKVGVLTPKPKDETASIFNNFKKIIPRGINIGITHVLFQMIDKEVMELLKARNLILIIDETLDCIKVQQDITPFETRIFFESGLLTFDDSTNKVSWNHEAYRKIQSHRFYNSKELQKFKKWCDDGALYFQPDKNKKFEDYLGKFIWMLPPEIFSCFKEVRILTYGFKNTFMEKYLEIHKLNYEINSMDINEENKKKKKIKELVTIVENKKYNSIGEQFRLTHDFHKKITNAQAEAIAITCHNMIRNHKKKIENVMWTCPKKSIEKIVGVNSKGKLLKDRTKVKLFNQHDHNSEKTSTYMYSNARATNVYGHKTIALYLIDRYMNPNLKQFFNKKGFPVNKVVEDKFALNELRQWVWRSAIRNDAPIDLFLPSKRMRDLLIDWLDSKRIVDIPVIEESITEPLFGSDVENEVVCLDESEFYKVDGITVVKYADHDKSLRLGKIGASYINPNQIISRATKKEVDLFGAGLPLSITEHISIEEPPRFEKWGKSRAKGIIIKPWAGKDVA